MLFGQYLVQRGLATHVDIVRARSIQRRMQKQSPPPPRIPRMGELLVELRILTRDQLAAALREHAADPNGTSTRYGFNGRPRTGRLEDDRDS